MSRVNRRAIPPAPPRIQDRPGRWKLLWRNQRRRLRTVALLGGLAVFVFGGLYTVQASSVTAKAGMVLIEVYGMPASR